jgi:hypothetical protein
MKHGGTTSDRAINVSASIQPRDDNTLLVCVENDIDNNAVFYSNIIEKRNNAVKDKTYSKAGAEGGTGMQKIILSAKEICTDPTLDYSISGNRLRATVTLRGMK